MASDNFFNRMYLTTNNVLYNINNNERRNQVEELYKQRLSNRLVNTSNACMMYDAACLGLLPADASPAAIVHAFIEYAKICNVNVIPDNTGSAGLQNDYPNALEDNQKSNVLFLNPFWNPYDQGPFPLSDLIHDSEC